MKIGLRELGIPFYDPLLIIEKTAGRMAEDDFWIRIER
jgi:putative transcriptional regulator